MSLNGNANAEDGSVLTLPTRLDSAAAEAFRSQLLERQGQPLRLDGQDTTLLGGRCLEILVAARRSWSKAGQQLSITRPSDALRRDLRLLGVSADIIEEGRES